ncbi:hypothetical protein GCM10009693_03430 [Leucobacter chromiireducens subsp. chromiireducens]
MASEILNHPYVGDSGRERALAPCLDLVYRAKVTTFNPTTQAHESRVKPLDMSDRCYKATILEELDKTRGGIEVMGNGFLDKRMNPSSCKRKSNWLVVDRGNCHNCRIYARSDKLLNLGIEGSVPRYSMRVAHRIAEAYEFDAFNLTQHARVVTPHHAEPDETKLEGHVYSLRIYAEERRCT